jgi:putative membrane protein
MVDYDPHDWRSHLLDIKGSMVREIILRVLSCVAFSVLVVALHVSGYAALDIHIQAHILVGSVLGLLLVFRTNSAYDRFWEGRKLWGSIVNECRNLARQSSVLLAADPARASRIIRWLVAFAWLTMHHLRRRVDRQAIIDHLVEDEMHQALATSHPPLKAMRQITRELAEARKAGLLSDYTQMAMDQNVQLLVDFLGGCERIRNTPTPFAYVVHLRRALIVYCFTLPMALVELFGWHTIPIVLVVAYTMFGVEEIGVEIEEPFGDDDNDLPLERICRTIEDNLQSILLELEPQPAASNGDIKVEPAPRPEIVRA